MDNRDDRDDRGNRGTRERIPPLNPDRPNAPRVDKATLETDRTCSVSCRGIVEALRGAQPLLLDNNKTATTNQNRIQNQVKPSLATNNIAFHLRPDLNHAP